MSAKLTPGGPEGNRIPRSPQATEASSRGLRLSPWVGLVLALVAGAIAWLLVQRYHPVFRVAKEYENFGVGAPQEKLDALRVAQDKVDLHNALLEFGVLGVLVGAVFALGEAVARRSVRAAIVALVAAVLLGGLGGLAAGAVGNTAHRPFGKRGVPAELSDTVKVQVFTLATLGMGVGLAIGVSTLSLRTAVVSALAGLLVGVLAGFLYPVVLFSFWPTTPSDSLIPAGRADRLLWIGLFVALLGLLVPAVARQPPAARKR